MRRWEERGGSRWAGTYKLPAAPQITKSILPSSDLVFSTAASSSAVFLTSAEAGIHRLPVAFDNLSADSSRPFALSFVSARPPSFRFNPGLSGMEVGVLSTDDDRVCSVTHQSLDDGITYPTSSYSFQHT